MKPSSTLVPVPKFRFLWNYQEILISVPPIDSSINVARDMSLDEVRAKRYHNAQKDGFILLKRRKVGVIAVHFVQKKMNYKLGKTPSPGAQYHN